ncbi:MAG: GGDEF domain-containing protein, partial [Acidobacteria bacterium]|nr:GGDEF domain-containing protein [Acidobacteriota bacterium]
LGLGAAALPVLFVTSGVAPAGLATAVALALATLARRGLEGRWPELLPERRRLARVLVEIAAGTLAALVAGSVWILLGGGEEVAPIAGRLAAAAAAWVLVAVGQELLLRRRARRYLATELPDVVQPMAIDVAGFALGGLLLVAARAGGGWLAVALGVAFAALAGEAARNALGAGALSRRLAETERLSRAGATLVTGASGLRAVAEQILAECRAIVPFSWFQLELEIPDAGRRSFWAATGIDLSEGEPAPPRQPPALPGIHRRGSWQVLERDLEVEGERLGKLRLWCDPRRLEPRAEELLAALSPQMSASVRGAFLDQVARTDRLTGAASRRVLEARLVDAFNACREEGGTLTVALADLDHFKRINDGFGHAVGDRALQAVASVLLGPARGVDLCARWGGEEFVLLFAGLAGEAALEIVERLRRSIEHLDLDAEGEPLALTMSFGVAAFPALHVRRPEELIELADAALYTAKRLGRNLCLLDIGGGRLQTASGEIVEVAEPAEPRAPVIFA